MNNQIASTIKIIRIYASNRYQVTDSKLQIAHAKYSQFQITNLRLQISNNKYHISDNIHQRFKYQNFKIKSL